MGGTVSRVVCCFVPKSQHDAVTALFTDPLDEGLGHSFVYVRPILDSLECSPNEEFPDVVDAPPPDSNTMTQNPPSIGKTEEDSQQGEEDSVDAPAIPRISETSFKSISGASVSANTATPRCIVYHDQFSNSLANSAVDRAAAFDCTSSFSALPLQPIPRGICFSGPMSGPIPTSGTDKGAGFGFLSGPLERSFVSSGPLERGFMSGPIERGFMSGPMERGYNSGPLYDRGTFSGPISGPLSAYLRRRRKYLATVVKTVGKPMKRVITKTVSNLTRTTRRSLVAPMSGQSVNSDGRRDLRSFLNSPQSAGYSSSDVDGIETHNLHWAQGKAGEDRVHVVLSEEHGWLFVGIYDGFSGPDATDFLMSNLYPAIYKELKGLLWDHHKAFQLPPRWRSGSRKEAPVAEKIIPEKIIVPDHQPMDSNQEEACAKDKPETRGLSHAKVSDLGAEIRKWDAQNAEQPGNGGGGVTEDVNGSTIDCTGGDKPYMNGDGGTGSVIKQHGRPRSLLSNKFKQAYSRRRRAAQRKVFQYRCEWEQERLEAEREREERRQRFPGRRPVNHAAVLKALGRALENTEEAYLEMIDEMFEDNPELALMGSCVLVMLMKDEDVYIMNVGDSRAVLAQQRKAVSYDSLRPARQRQGSEDGSLELERIVEETPMDLAAFDASHHSLQNSVPPAVSATLGALQLSLDHCTSIVEEVLRIKAEHPDDGGTILNDRVKGKLAVTRAFGAGFLKQPKWNDSLLEVFRIQYIGNAPYISCTPYLRHYKLGPQDQFLVLSSDGVYQYLSNDEVVARVEWFMDKYPDGDPAQFLIEEVLFRAARKAGMEFHDLLDIPQGDRRKYHDDLSVMVISLEGRIWRSSS